MGGEPMIIQMPPSVFAEDFFSFTL